MIHNIHINIEGGTIETNDLVKQLNQVFNLFAKKEEIQAIKDSTYTKDELKRELKISGLEAEKRMIQATDRKLLDVRRQTEIEEEIKRLNSK